MTIKDLIPKGKENAISREALVNACLAHGLIENGHSDRAMRNLLHSERKGTVILYASSGGYYIPTDPQEIREYIKSEEHRAISTMSAIRYARILLEDLEKGRVVLENG